MKANRGIFIHLLCLRLESDSLLTFSADPNYLGYHQRKVGCYGAGDRFFYIDTKGYAHICPYCTGKVANVTDHTAKEVITLLSGKVCLAFGENRLFPS